MDIGNRASQLVTIVVGGFVIYEFGEKRKWWTVNAGEDWQFYVLLGCLAAMVLVSSYLLWSRARFPRGAVSGLVVHRAYFQVWGSWWKPKEDYTNAVKAMVNDDRLDFLPSERFGDPFPNKPKRFVVEYSFNGVPQKHSEAKGERITLGTTSPLKRENEQLTSQVNAAKEAATELTITQATWGNEFNRVHVNEVISSKYRNGLVFYVCNDAFPGMKTVKKREGDWVVIPEHESQHTACRLLETQLRDEVSQANHAVSAIGGANNKLTERFVSPKPSTLEVQTVLNASSSPNSDPGIPVLVQIGNLTNGFVNHVTASLDFVPLDGQGDTFRIPEACWLPSDERSTSITATVSVGPKGNQPLVLCKADTISRTILPCNGSYAAKHSLTFGRWAVRLIAMSETSVVMKARITFRALKDGQIIDVGYMPIEITGAISASEEL
jgi:hypothetical protein